MNKKERELRKGVVIDSFGNIVAIISTRETAGMHTFSHECIKNEYGGFTTVNDFVARLSFSKKLLDKATEVLGVYVDTTKVYHIHYQKQLDGSYKAIKEC